MSLVELAMAHITNHIIGGANNGARPDPKRNSPCLSDYDCLPYEHCYLHSLSTPFGGICQDKPSGRQMRDASPINYDYYENINNNDAQYDNPVVGNQYDDGTLQEETLDYENNKIAQFDNVGAQATLKPAPFDLEQNMVNPEDNTHDEMKLRDFGHVYVIHGDDDDVNGSPGAVIGADGTVYGTSNDYDESVFVNAPPVHGNDIIDEGVHNVDNFVEVDYLNPIQLNQDQIGPSGIETDVDIPDYVAHSPGDLEAAANSASMETNGKYEEDYGYGDTPQNNALYNNHLIGQTTGYNSKFPTTNHQTGNSNNGYGQGSPRHGSHNNQHGFNNYGHRQNAQQNPDYNNALSNHQQGYNNALPNHQQGYNNALPNQQQGYNNALSNHQQGYNNALPNQQQGYNNALPNQQQGYNNALPNQQQGYNNALPNQQQGYNNALSNHQQGYNNGYNSPLSQNGGRENSDNYNAFSRQQGRNGVHQNNFQSSGALNSNYNNGLPGQQLNGDHGINNPSLSQYEQRNSTPNSTEQVNHPLGGLDQANSATKVGNQEQDYTNNGEGQSSQVFNIQDYHANLADSPNAVDTGEENDEIQLIEENEPVYHPDNNPGNVAGMNSVMNSDTDNGNAFIDDY
uniref:GATA zinc finger domain-containing protein 14-like n=1 Tax=Saccoglossus kowalevskii TaxID=10224 RepID=A0ABM0MMC1_SACKO|nr:PREDICTED: GATA zinc finger domain-containing protein 14-like [Saccoglossus kowalevskii]